MGKILLVFLSTTIFFAVMLHLLQRASKDELWSFFKLFGFSIICSVLTMITLSAVVFLF